jgi:serine/threonine protein kinase
MYWYGQSGDYNVLVMELLGPSLHKLWEPQQRLPVDYVLRIAPKMLQRLELCHANGILHRDIKLENFVVAPHDHEQIYLIDFGLSKSFIKNGAHIPLRTDKPFLGTARYCSINAHLGYEQSRRDDLQGLAYVLIYLCKGSLPWQGVGGATRQARNRAIGTAKQRTSAAALCAGLPRAFEQLLTYARELEFYDEPDYLWCRSLF